MIHKHANDKWSAKAQAVNSKGKSCQDWALYVAKILATGNDFVGSNCRRNVVEVNCTKQPNNIGQALFCLHMGVRGVPMNSRAHNNMQTHYGPIVSNTNGDSEFPRMGLSHKGFDDLKSSRRP